MCVCVGVSMCVSVFVCMRACVRGVCLSVCASICVCVYVCRPLIQDKHLFPLCNSTTFHKNFYNMTTWTHKGWLNHYMCV